MIQGPTVSDRDGLFEKFLDNGSRDAIIGCVINLYLAISLARPAGGAGETSARGRFQRVVRRPFDKLRASRREEIPERRARLRPLDYAVASRPNYRPARDYETKPILADCVSSRYLKSE